MSDLDDCYLYLTSQQRVTMRGLRQDDDSFTGFLKLYSEDEEKKMRFWDRIKKKANFNFSLKGASLLGIPGKTTQRGSALEILLKIQKLIS